MQATLQLPDDIYRRTQETADARGLSVDKLIADLLERELVRTAVSQTTASEKEANLSASGPRDTGKRITLPLIHSSRPGTIDLSDFDFYDLLA